MTSAPRVERRQGRLIVGRGARRLARAVAKRSDQAPARGAEIAAAPACMPPFAGASYRNQWWVTHNAHGAFMARGVHGQGIYIDPRAEMVIARYASHPMAGNAANDPVTLPAYMALAKDLMAGG